MRIQAPEDLRAIRNRFDTPGEVCLNLLLVNACSYKCAHCMFSCGPKPKSQIKWMGTNELDEVLLLAEQFQSAGHSVSMNLIGGEPTLDMDELARILDYLGHHPIGRKITYEMTTNGWWLKTWNSVCGFAMAVGPFIREHEMIIRISNTEYHEEFRNPIEKKVISGERTPAATQWGQRTPSRLEQLLENPFDYYDLRETCPNCDEPVQDQYCRHCDQEVDEADLDHSYCVPGHQWVQNLIAACKDDHLYVDFRSPGEDKISPVGRAAKNGIGYQVVQCELEQALLTIHPTGAIQGICCTGGNVPLGHVRDGAWQLFALAALYIRAVKTKYPGKTSMRCRECSSFAATWVAQRKSALVEAIQQDSVCLQCVA
jgi:hypothetical protein